MKKVTITQLKDNLSALLARAAQGEEIIIFDRKKPLVRLIALFQYAESDGAKDQQTAERLSKLEADGLVSRRKQNSLGKLLQRPRPRSKASIVDALIEERDREL